MQLMVKVSTVYGEPLFMRYQVRSELKVSKPIGDMQKVGGDGGAGKVLRLRGPPDRDSKAENNCAWCMKEV